MPIPRFVTKKITDHFRFKSWCVGDGGTKSVLLQKNNGPF